MFFPLLYLSWGLQAIYAGFAAAFAMDGRRSPVQRLLPVTAAFISLTCTALFLLSQNFFSGLFLNFGVSVTELALFFASLVIVWRIQSRIETCFRIVNLGTFLTSLLWFAMSPSCFFLPLLFFPDADLPAFHFTFLTAYGLTFAATLGTLAVVRRQRPEQSGTQIHQMHRPPRLIIGLLGTGLVVAIYFSPAIQTLVIEHARNHTFKVSQAARDLAHALSFADEERRASGERSVYPADNGITSASEYIRFLRKNGYLREDLPVDPSEFDFANVSRSDPGQTLLVRSKAVQYDIHTMYDGSPPPDYKRGFIVAQKDGGGNDFIRGEKKDAPEIETLPPRTPAFLAP
jgi:hypothetical protein